MGLDMYFIKSKEDKEEMAYFRKCYGINNWIKSKCKKIEDNYLFDTSILPPILEKMKIYLDKMISVVEQDGYFIVSQTYKYEDLRLLVCEMDEDQNETYIKLDKIIKSFNIDGLTYNNFEDGIWSTVGTFIQAYQQFTKLEGQGEIIYIESF